MSDALQLTTAPATQDYPTFLAVCREIGYPEAAAAVNTWNEHGQDGWFTDPQYTTPAAEVAR